MYVSYSDNGKVKHGRTHSPEEHAATRHSHLDVHTTGMNASYKVCLVKECAKWNKVHAGSFTSILKVKACT